MDIVGFVRKKGHVPSVKLGFFFLNSKEKAALMSIWNTILYVLDSIF